MKKILRSKGFLVSVLSVSCVAILAVCWLVSRDTKTDFQPDEQPPDPFRKNGRIPRISRIPLEIPGYIQMPASPVRTVRRKNWKNTRR